MMITWTVSDEIDSDPCFLAAIDYLSSLVNEQTSLLQRLDHARSILPPGHPLLEIPSQPPCWERQWTGGEGKADDDDEDAEEDAPSR